MTVHFVGGTAQDFFAEGSTVLTDVTTTNARDTAYSDYELRQTQIRDASTPISQEFPPSPDMWAHYRTRYAVDIFGQFASGYFLQVFNAAGQLLARLQKVGTNSSAPVFCTVYGDTTENAANSILTGNLAFFTEDVRVRVTATSITMDYYRDGSLVNTATAANTTGSKGPATRFEWSSNDVVDGTSGFQYFSEIIITDGESTLGWRLGTLTPDGVGFHADFDGNWEELSDLNFTTAAATDTDGDRVSSTLSAYGGTATTTNVRGVFGKAIASRGDTGPANAVQFIRIGSTDYDGATQALAVDNTSLLQEWSVNPATSSPWDTAALAALELGIKAET